MTEDITGFLPCVTPERWFEVALENLDVLLIDHANCEKEAAATAMNLMYRHVENTELLMTMSYLAREELLHFQQVVNVLKDRDITYRRLSPSRYASGLRQHIDNSDKNGLIDTLIIGAFVEARSCERFSRLAPLLDPQLGKFYNNLVKSESRHFTEYLNLAQANAGRDIADRIDFFATVEKDLVQQIDSDFRFHSGLPR